MKKLIYYLIFLLALVMMVLCSSACRSQKTMTYSKATTDSVSLCVRDSSAQRFEFTFDSLELWFPDLRTAPLVFSELPKFRSSGISHHIVVYGGKITANITRAMSQDSTSTKTTRESKTTRISPSPSSLLTSHSSLLTLFLILFALAILLFLLIRLRSSS